MTHPLAIVSLLALALSISACDTPRSDPPREAKGEDSGKEAGSEGEAEPKPADPNSCMPGGLEAAKPVEVVVLAKGCRVVATGTLVAPTIVTDAAGLSAAIACDPGALPPAVDFAKHQLNVATYSLSPAFGGSAIVDDGKRVTFVQRDRSPCPDDPLPMPIGADLAYLLPAGAERSYAQQGCTLPPRCD